MIIMDGMKLVQRLSHGGRSVFVPSLFVDLVEMGEKCVIWYSFLHPLNLIYYNVHVLQSLSGW